MHIELCNLKSINFAILSQKNWMINPKHACFYTTERHVSEDHTFRLLLWEVVLFVWTSEFLNFQKNSLQTGAVVLFVWTFFMSEKERKFRQIVYALFISDYLYELQIFSSWNHKRKWKWPLNRAKSNDDISRTLSWTTLTKRMTQASK